MYVPQDRPRSEPSFPEPGTLIDNGSLELVEILGVGGYGVVYRAVDARSTTLRNFAVKCLQHLHTPRQRQLHIREIALHQLCSAHPNVVTIHRVIEENNFTFIVLDFAPDGDLFSQILYGCRYLGNTRLIKHVFNQLLDAVEYCHSLGIYHRDLKPENVLCFDGGYRVALTDFGLATTEKLSEEFRTGSVYHMSPECQGGELSPTGSYSPMFNDIWSLGIVLLNLATGRNPWKAAILTDSTFRAYLQDPSEFLPSVLPISSELNAVLVRMLEIDWRDRITIPELRVALARVKNFYSEGAVFDGSMARCPWEVGVDLEAASAEPEETKEESPVVPDHRPIPSAWSSDSSFAYTHPQDDATATGSDSSSSTQYSSCGATWAFDSPTSSESSAILQDKYIFERPRTPPMPNNVPIISPRPAFIVTPSIVDLTSRATGRKPPLTINTARLDPQFYAARNISLSLASASTASSVMRTAVDEDDESNFFLASSKVSSPGYDLDDKEMTSALWDETGALSNYCSTQSSFANNDTNNSDRSATPSPDTEAGAWHASQCQFSSSISDSITDSPPRSPESDSDLESPQDFAFAEHTSKVLPGAGIMQRLWTHFNRLFSSKRPLPRLLRLGLHIRQLRRRHRPRRRQSTRQSHRPRGPILG
ncbi:Serine/threonine protein kinase [Mycena indigotica]|uniref:non-specific serine/threonine protein kinase n=1 Tax=Mycena indigotica TaxID=2126181 RepID=A0A8H6TGD0_9AGAR|nr:Serine/threonine protein kinase [Mycena indigotica]KAF7316227.1 Serine/threonine protein kinase [Mycena indigotica]